MNKFRESIKNLTAEEQSAAKIKKMIEIKEKWASTTPEQRIARQQLVKSKLCKLYCPEDTEGEMEDKYAISYPFVEVSVDDFTKGIKSVTIHDPSPTAFIKASKTLNTLDKMLGDRTDERGFVTRILEDHAAKEISDIDNYIYSVIDGGESMYEIRLGKMVKKLPAERRQKSYLFSIVRKMYGLTVEERDAKTKAIYALKYRDFNWHEKLINKVKKLVRFTK